MSACNQHLKIALAIMVVTATYAIICTIFNAKYKIIMPLMVFLSQLWIVASVRPESLSDLTRKIGISRVTVSVLLVLLISCASRAESFEVMAINAPAFIVFLISALCATSKNIQPPSNS